MHRNQFLISADQVDGTRVGLEELIFDSLHVYHHPSLGVAIERQEQVCLLLLGYLIDPARPDSTNEDIMRSLADDCPTKDDFFRKLQPLCGRFVVVYRSPTDAVVVGDACGARPIFYSLDNQGKLVITSSLELFWDLFKTNRESSNEKIAVLNSMEFEKTERAWFGYESPDNRLARLLANHYLDLKNRIAKRIPIDQSQLVNEEDAREFVAETLKRSLMAIKKRFKIALPVTAGWDSRTSLAACKDLKSSIDFFVFAQPDQDETADDIRIPLRLTGRLGLPFKVIRPGPVRQDFLDKCNSEKILPLKARMGELQYLSDTYSNQKAVRVSGLAADIMKSSFYGHTKRDVTVEMLYAFSGYYGRSQYVREQIGAWLRSAEPFCRENNIRVPDLFYWEQRIGTWGAQYAFEQDLAMEEYWPHGQRNLLISALRIDPKKRARPSCEFYRDLVAKLWKETLAEPCNPLTPIGVLKWKLRNNSFLRFQKIRLAG